MRHVALALGLAIALAAPAYATAACHEDLNATQADERIAAAEAIVLDVRTGGEFRSSTGHIDGALLVPVDQLEAALDQLADLRDRPVIVVCRSGNRSAVASRILCRAGFAEVFNLSGGMNAWLRAGLPVVRE